MAEAVKRVFATEEAKAADANKPEPAAEATATGDAGASSPPMPWVIGGAAHRCGRWRGGRSLLLPKEDAPLGVRATTDEMTKAPATRRGLLSICCLG